MKILFICPPTETPFPCQSEYPIGLLYLERILYDNGHECLVRNYYSQSFEEAKKQILKEVADFKPNIVGLNCMSMNRTSCFRLANMLKEINPEIKLIMGGVHASSMYEQILLNFPVDAIVLGEGELTILPLIKAFENKKKLNKIKGIAFKESESGKIYFTGPQQHIEDLDALHFPRHELFEHQIKQTKNARMMTSRGCPFGCTYCSTSAYWGRRWRPRSPANVVAEIEEIIKKMPFVEEIFFYDDTFTVDNQRVIDICDMIIKKGIKLRLKCSGRVDRVSREMLLKMKEAGFADIAYGIESGSAQILKAMNKGITKEQIKAAIDLTNEVGLTWHGFMMVGCPGETWDTVKESTEFVKTLKNFDTGSVALLEIYPNTAIYEKAKENGFDESLWLTDAPVPHYTYEHSEEELKKMAIYIVAQSKLNKNVFKLISFSLGYFFQKPGKAIKYAIRYLKGIK